MNEYNFIFVWLVIFAILANTTNVTVWENVHGKDVRRWNIVLAFLGFLPIFLLASFGDPIGDTPLYIDNFNALPTTLSGLMDQIVENESGQGFEIFEFVVKRVFGNNETVFRIILAAIHSIPVVWILRKYSDSYLMSIFLFVASAYHVSWMMNGLRQFMAVAIIFASTPLMFQKKYTALMVVILFASTIHISAIIMLPVIFIVQGKAWNKKTVLYIVIALMAMYVFDQYTGLVDFMLEGTEFEGAVEQWQEWGDDGTNPIRVLVNSIPMLLAFLGREHIRYENNKTLNVCVNMSVITTGLYLISMVTSGIMIGRLPIYTSLYNLILLPNLIAKVFTKNSARIINIGVIIFYMIYYYLETLGKF